MKVLVACEFSGIVRDAFLKNGHDAVSCDLLPTERPGPHIQGDVVPHLNKGWDLMIAHPPCTRLCNSGVRWLHERNLWDEMEAGANFFKLLLNAPIPKVAVENPVMHKYAVQIIGSRHAFTIQPWQFGDPFKKRTCFWTRNLPPLKTMPGTSELNAAAEVHIAAPGPNRWKERSRTYPRVAQAIADQWGSQNFALPIQPTLFSDDMGQP